MERVLANRGRVASIVARTGITLLVVAYLLELWDSEE